jgi:prepilin peptidase CpaA
MTSVVLLVVLGGAAAWDLRARVIPHAFPAALLGLAVVDGIVTSGEPSWPARAAGLSAGLLVGAGLFALGALGGGDVKLLAGLGAVLGLGGLAGAAPWIALAGGVLSAAAWLRGRREVAYAPAIAVGALAVVLRGAP